LRSRSAIALAIALSAPWCLQAQEADTLAAASVYSVQVFPVVRPSEEVYLPGVAAPPAQVADLLRRFTGVQVKDYGGVGGLKTVNVRSLGSEHVGVFLDGVQVDNAQNMQVDLGRFSTDGIGTVVVATGGTSDIPVAEEAALTAEYLGNEVCRLYDVGVSGIHRLLSHKEEIMNASVIIAVAGMEGALASVVGGLADCPVIAVPTSVGYGAAFGGITALLSMLNSCASGVSVVNIDNGFGAGYLAAMINHMEVSR